MNKLKFILPILLLTILVLIGGSCGKDENGDVNLGNVNLNKELSESEIRYVLNKTADDLGWTGYEISGREGWYTLQVKSGLLVRRGIVIINVSWLPMLIAESNKDNFLNKYYEQEMAMKKEAEMYGYDPEYAGMEVEMIKISGFDTCHIREYLKAWRDLEDCSEDDFAHIVIGNYLLQAMTHDMKEGRGVACEMENVMPVADALVKNFLEALK